MDNIVSNESKHAPSDASTPDGDRRERSWPGAIEFALIFGLAPGVLMWMLFWFLTRLLGGSMNLVVGVVAGMASALWLVYCFSKYHRDVVKRNRHWNGLHYPVPVRWSAIGLLLVASAVILVAARPRPSTDGNPTVKPVSKEIADAAQKTFDNTPYKDDDETRRKRGEAGLVADVAKEQSAGGKGDNGAGSKAGTIIFVINNSPSNPQPSSDVPSIPVYIPDADRGDNIKRTQIIKKGGGLGPGWFALGPAALPAVAVMNVLGIGGSTEYRRITMETMSQALEGKTLDDKTRAEMITELSKLTAAQISAWSAAAKKAIDGADVDSQRIAKAKELIDAIVTEAVKQGAALDAPAAAIADNIVKAVTNNPLKPDEIKVIVEQSRQNPPPALRNKIRENLEKQGDWEAKIKAGWEGYESSEAGSP